MTLFSLGARLSAAADFIRGADTVIDVGSDHARLPVWLLLNGIIKKAYASDISPYSVSKAKRAAVRYKLGDCLFAMLSDGLNAFCSDDADTVVIAGMGGDVIAEIMRNAPWLADGKHTVIVQCMSSLDVLNDFLAQHGYICLDEKIVTDSGRIYSVAKLRGAVSAKDGCRGEFGRIRADYPDFVLPSPHICGSALRSEYLNKFIVSACKKLNGLKLMPTPDPALISKLERAVEYYKLISEVRKNADSI